MSDADVNLVLGDLMICHAWYRPKVDTRGRRQQYCVANRSKLSHALAVSVEAVGGTVGQFDSYLKHGYTVVCMHSGATRCRLNWRLAVRLRCSMQIAKAHRCGGEGVPSFA